MVKVSLNTQTRDCIADSTFLGFEGENEANTLVFSFEDKFIDGIAVLNIQRGTDKGYVAVDKLEDSYELPVKSSLLSQMGDVTFQLVITSSNGTVMKFNSFVMTVKDAIDTDAELPEEYPSWIEMANEKLSEMDKAIEDAEKLSAKVEPTENGALITITDKEGTTSVEVLNGSGGSGEGGTANYRELVNKPKINNVELIGNKTLNELGIQPKGNYLTSTDESDPLYSKDKPNIALKSEIPTKVSELANDSNFASETYVDEEIAKFDFIKVVDALPSTGLPNRIYFVPKSDTQTQDLFDEYVWINDKWEWITTKQIEVDMTEYPKKDELPDISTKQDTLVSGGNIKTINGESILGSGNINIKGDSGGASKVTLWSGSINTAEQVATLSQSLEDFDYLLIKANLKNSANAIRYLPVNWIDCNDIKNSYDSSSKIAVVSFADLNATTSLIIYAGFDNATTMTIYAVNSKGSINSYEITEIIGVKF